MKSVLIEMLQTLNYPVFLQGTLNPDESYPASFFTFWNPDTPEGAFYDNDAHLAEWRFNIFFYSIDPQLVEIVPEQARKLLKQKGFILNGKPHDIASGRDTHTGVTFSVTITENYESED